MDLEALSRALLEAAAAGDRRRLHRMLADGAHVQVNGQAAAPMDAADALAMSLASAGPVVVEDFAPKRNLVFLQFRGQGGARGAGVLAWDQDGRLASALLETTAGL